MLKTSNTITIQTRARGLVLRLALAALAALTLGARGAAAQAVTMITANASNTAAGNGASYFPRLSADGRFVTFQSSSSDLVPGDNNNADDAFVRDLQTGAVTLVSVNRQGTSSCDRGAGAGSITPDGRFVTFVSNCTDLTTTPPPSPGSFAVQVYVRDLVLQKTTLVSVNAAGTAAGNHNSLAPVITPDGRFVAFASVASDLTTLADPGVTVDVFLRDMQAGTTKLISVNAAGTAAGNRESSSASVGSVVDPAVSNDGRFVVFNSHATDLTTLPDTNGAVDVFVRDTLTGTTSLASVNKTGDAAGKGQSENPSMSADGRYVLFGSTSNDLVAATAGVGVSDLFLRDTQAGTTTLVSAALDGKPGGSGPAHITPDGRFVVFSSGSNNMVAGVSDTSAHFDVFLRDLKTNTTSLVTYNRWGTHPADDDSFSAVVSDDGRFVAFQSEADNLTEEADTFSSNDIFVRDMASGTTRMVSVNRTGAASAAGGSVFPAISGGGTRVAFSSDSNEVTALPDTNNASDLFAYAVPQALTEPSVVQLSAAEYFGSESGGPVLITVTRTGDTSAPATVEYATSDGTASERTDYAAALGTLRFAAGETQKTFEIIVNDDPFVEGEETFTLRLSSPYRAQLGARSQATVRVTSNDTTPPGSLNLSDDTSFFVRQHYRDFLNREPDAAGLAFWTNEIEGCGADAQCREVKRVNVSAAFFLSIEFQETGFFVYRVRMLAGGQLRGPSNPVPINLRDFLHDVREVSEGVVVGEPNWQQRLEANKQAYVEDVVGREWFADTFPVWMGGGFASKLGDGSNRELPQATVNSLAAGLTSGQLTRAQALRAAAEDPTFTKAELNRAFVLMEYFGYLRRNPNDAPEPNRDFSGYDFWLGKLNQFNGNYIDAEMVKAYVTSLEYRQRFGQP
jgi:Tol biopolymer transport system component